MRCPKCQYISYDSGERCRNCGYEFAFAAEDDAPVDVSIRREEPAPGRIRDGTLTALEAPLAPPDTDADPRLGDAALERLAGLPSASDLPLFTERVADDQAPLVSPPAVPRPPLAVRRAAPMRGRSRGPEPEELPLDLGPAPAETALHPAGAAHAAAPDDTAGIVRRALAGMVDLVILSAICSAVVYLTLRLCGLTAGDWRVLPVVPLAAFLLLLCGGYFVLFTAAGGQTIGKMIAGIRVVNAAADAPLRVSFGTAFARAVASLGSVLFAGAGFLPILFRADRRAFHDRVAQTRVVAA
jgi:uncharacterized RDD family membrane protein YckC